MGQGGVECGSVWFVSAYHSGCDEWLDDMSRVVFGRDRSLGELCSSSDSFGGGAGAGLRGCSQRLRG